MNQTEQAAYYREQGLHSKYGYTGMEMMAMIFITGVTNFVVIPAIIVIYKQRMIFQFYVANFTLLCSFMYHFMESIDCQQFIVSESGWHRLDNIGSIVCFQILISMLSDLKNRRLENYLNYTGLLISLIAQAKDPWNLYYTVCPILFHLALCLAIVIRRNRLPQLNLKIVAKGLAILSFAVFFFTKSQDEYSDYLRLNHGMWHTCIGLMSFYMWQSKIQEHYSWFDFYKRPMMPDTAYYKEL